MNILLTERGFEIADSTGTLNAEQDSPAYLTYEDAEQAYIQDHQQEREYERVRIRQSGDRE